MKFRGIKKGDFNSCVLQDSNYMRQNMILELTDTVATDTRSAQDEACQTPMMNGGRSHEASQLPVGAGELLAVIYR